MQIRARLTVLFSLIATGILATVLFAVWWTFRHYTEETFYQNLASKARFTMNTTWQDPSNLKPLPSIWVSTADDTLPYHDNISLYNDAYERVFTVQPEMEPVPVKTLQAIQQNGELRFKNQQLLALGMVLESKINRPFYVVVEGYCDPSALNQLRNILIVSFICGLTAISASGWYYAGQALAPVSAIINQVKELRPSDLSKRLMPGKNRDEMAQLAATFNSLLDRVEHAFRMQRMFLSNVSHELKNPLTAIRTQLDVALQRERSPEAYRKALESVLEDVHTMDDVEDNLLQLARLYNDPKAIPLGQLRIDEILWQAREQLVKRKQEYKAVIDIESMPPTEEALWVEANETLLKAALVNLMDNACKYSPDQKVQVKVRFQDDGRHQIDICDQGPGIPQNELPLVFEPFYRSPRHRTVKGTGIGLSLVQSIADLHRINLSVFCPESGGTVFRLVFNPDK